METGALIATSIVATTAFACLLAGLCGLLSPDEQDINRLRKEVREAMSRGRLETYITMQWSKLHLSQIVLHWRSRPGIRRLVWMGLTCFLLALLGVIWMCT
jgi:hypothetical protein